MHKKRNSRAAYPFLMPALLSILIVTCLPIIYTIVISFTNYNLNHIEHFNWIGLKNYIEVFSGSIRAIFFPVLGWTIVFATISTAGAYAVGMFLAVLLNNPNMKESKFYRAILIIPWALPATIAILAWQGLLNEEYGGINNLLHTLGITKSIPWMTNVFWARFGIVMVNIWLGFPYMLNVCLGSLQSIEPTFYEAAKIDGANRWKRFRYITFPLVFRVSVPLVVATFASNFNNFGNIYMITQGGPARMSSQYAGYTDILASTTYKMTTWSNRYDLAATFSVLVFIIVGALTLINMNLSGSFKEVDS
ncbi:maltose/maltodextrin ABC transporter, permease protein MalF [Lachnospiraceae bacterium KM106-2]|nr:maltose/maltodextrin ABC transporter, permease protein MalF [Lachnospiraceae bacterium KM106-2]